MVLLLLVELQILYNKAAAGRDLVCGIGIAGNDDRQLDDLLELCDAGVKLALLVLRLIVLSASLSCSATSSARVVLRYSSSSL